MSTLTRYKYALIGLLLVLLTVLSIAGHDGGAVTGALLAFLTVMVGTLFGHANEAATVQQAADKIVQQTVVAQNETAANGGGSN